MTIIRAANEGLWQSLYIFNILQVLLSNDLYNFKEEEFQEQKFTKNPELLVVSNSRPAEF